MRRLREIKTPYEISQFRLSAERHAQTYVEIPSCFRPGMTDLELQYEIEKRMRQNGSLGLFRAFGPNMDIFMGSILAGENAETPSPFDFALGGGGMDASCPLGANGTRLKEGTAVMIDMAGNYTAYITDMTRVFAVGKLPELAYRAPPDGTRHSARDRADGASRHALRRTLQPRDGVHRESRVKRLFHGDQAAGKVCRARHRAANQRTAGIDAPLQRAIGTEHGFRA